MIKCNLGIDIGGTYTKITILNQEKKSIIENFKFKTNSQNSKEDIIKDIISNIKQIKKKHKKITISKINIAIPGLIDKNQKIVHLPNIPNLDNTDLKKEIKNEFKEVKVSIIKDSQSIYYFIKNDIKPKKNIAIITLGTSIACSIIINSKLYIGAGNSGEIAHNFFSNKEIEEKISNKTILKEIQKIDKKINSLEDLNDLKEITKEIRKVFENYGKNIGTALANLQNTLDLNLILLTGGMLFNQDLFFKKLKQEFENKVFVNPCKIEILENDPFIGSIGTALK